MNIKFVCAVYNERIFEANLKNSSIFSLDRFILQRGYTNVPLAYNNISKPDCDLICYIHEDVFLPNNWEDELRKSLQKINQIDLDWGVLGIAGVKPGSQGRQWHGNLIDRGRQWGSPNNLPSRVQTLDELLLICRSNNILRFDEDIPSNHFYGADICLQSGSRGQKCYAINAPCYHNSNTPRKLPADFHIAAEYIKQKWKEVLPIVTTCSILT